jgi:hypothetical protein
MDTVNDLFEKLDDSLLEELKVRLIKTLLHRRVLHKFRAFGKYFVVAIDGTGIFTFDKCPYEGCQFKESKGGKVTYYQSVVEAKIVCSNGFSISLASEFIKTEDGSTKQDCEYKATMRILAKLKKYFPRLPMLIVLDGLYAKQPLMDTIKSNGWEFGIVWKDKTLYKLQDIITEQEANNLLIKSGQVSFVSQNKRIESEYEHSTQALNHKGIDLYYAAVKEAHIKIQANKEKNSYAVTYKYLLSIKPDSKNIRVLIQSNRMRWKIENEGFNVQKNNGFKLEHKMNRNNLNAIKNYYHSLQIADIFNQLITHCKNSIVQAFGTIIKMWQYFWAELIFTEYEVANDDHIKINLRY